MSWVLMRLRMNALSTSVNFGTAGAADPPAGRAYIALHEMIGAPNIIFVWLVDIHTWRCDENLHASDMTENLVSDVGAQAIAAGCLYLTSLAVALDELAYSEFSSYDQVSDIGVQALVAGVQVSPVSTQVKSYLSYLSIACCWELCKQLPSQNAFECDDKAVVKSECRQKFVLFAKQVSSSVAFTAPVRCTASTTSGSVTWAVRGVC